MTEKYRKSPSDITLDNIVLLNRDEVDVTYIITSMKT